MKISDLMEILGAMQGKYGDINVHIYDSDIGDVPIDIVQYIQSNCNKGEMVVYIV